MPRDLRRSRRTTIQLGTGQRLPPAPRPAPPIVRQASSARPGRWELWFPALPALHPSLRPKTRSGKPKKLPPRLPPNINERRAMHPMTERPLVASWREKARLEAKRLEIPLLERARISAIVFRRALGVADNSGDAERLKPLVDGLVDAGVMVDDRRRFVEYGSVEEQRTGRGGEPGIRLIVEAVEPELVG